MRSRPCSRGPVPAELLAAISALVRRELPVRCVAGDDRVYTGSATIPAILLSMQPWPGRAAHCREWRPGRVGVIVLRQVQAQMPRDLPVTEKGRVDGCR